TPSKPFRWVSPATSLQNGTLRPPQSPCSSDKGFALLTSISRKPPWLDSGALNRNVVPAVQVPAPFAMAPAGSSAAAARHARAKNIPGFRTIVLPGELIVAPASPPHAPQLFQIALWPSSIPE